MRFLMFGQCSNCIKLTKKYDEEHLLFQSQGQEFMKQMDELKVKVGVEKPVAEVE